MDSYLPVLFRNAAFMQVDFLEVAAEGTIAVQNKRGRMPSQLIQAVLNRTDASQRCCKWMTSRYPAPATKPGHDPVSGTGMLMPIGSALAVQEQV
jgi:hypothetical protein